MKFNRASFPELVLFGLILTLWTGIAIYFEEQRLFLVQFAASILIIVAYYSVSRQRFPLQKFNAVHYLIGLFWSFVMVSSLANLDKQLNMGALKEYLISSLFMVFVCFIVDSKEKLHRLAWFIVIAGFIMSLIGAYNYFVGIDSEAMYQTGRGYERYNRATLFGKNSNYYAMELLTPILLAIGLFFEERNILRRALAVMVIIPMLWSLLFSYSRGGVLALGVGIAYLLYIKRLKVALGVCVPIFLVFWYFVGVNDALVSRLESLKSGSAVETFELRRYQSLAGLEMWSRNPIFGVGPGNISDSLSDTGEYAFAMTDYKYFHNTYVQLLAEFGMVPFLSFVLLVILTLRIIHRNQLVMPMNIYWAAALISITFANYALSSGSATEFWLIFGVGIVNKNLLKAKLTS